MNKPLSPIEVLADRERYLDEYRRRRDPIVEDRLLWRAQTVRHVMHLLPGQTILELGCGDGEFTRQLNHVSRGQNKIVAVTFEKDAKRPDGLPDNVEFICATNFPEGLGDREFDLVVSMDLLDERNSPWMLQSVYDLLKPGGRVLFFESNPWNVFLKIRRGVSWLVGGKDTRRLLDRTALTELVSETGFIRIFSVFNDFVFRPLTRPLIWFMRNLSILLENAPCVRTLAGSILFHAQKPPKVVPLPKVSLCEHANLRNSVSVVIPCYNEEMNIVPLVNRLRDLFDDYIYEIIPVDDNSKDSTREVIEQLAKDDPRIKPVIRKPPGGVGRAIADGYRAATGKWVLSMDCDFQHLLPEIRDLFDEAAAGNPVVVGSRFSRHSVLLNYPFQKIVANRAFHMLARIILWRHFRDMTNNLKLLRRDVVDNLVLTQPHFSVNAETGFQPLIMGYPIREVAISWINRTPDMGASSFRLLKVGGGYWQVLWQLWLKSAFGIGPYRALKDVTKTEGQAGTAVLRHATTGRH